MGKRTWIDSDIWNDTEGLNNQEQVVYLWLLTNSQRNIAGYYKVNLRYMALDLHASESRLEKMLLREQKYWVYDRATGQVLIPKFTRYNIVRSKQQYSALNAELNKLKPCPLHRKFLESFEEVNGVGSLEMIDPRFKERAKTHIITNKDL